MNALRCIVFHLGFAISLASWLDVPARGDDTPAESAIDVSLHVLIDQHLKPVSGIVPLRSSDAEFLRRVSLDLVGMPPTADEARAFLADTTVDKREQLVERLMASPHFARHLTSTLDLMLMERRANTHVTADDWQAWLLKSVRDNKPWNVLAREILAADGDDPAQRPAARFALDRASEPNLLTHDISRIFFGRDMQCAQCHDHPIVPDYLQSDYHGLLAFVAPGYALVRKEGDKQVTLHAERAGSDLSFESVFVKGTQHRTGPRMPDDLAVDEPFFLPGDEYLVAPADNVKSVPKFSRRMRLAEVATSGSNTAFNQNMANRLWAQMFGRGLVHPLDLHHPDNPATDPELLQLLGERFAAMNFDISAFLREIALSEVYQRSFDAVGDLTAAANQTAAQISELEQRQAALQTTASESAAAYSKALDDWHSAEATLLPVAGEFDAARNAYAEAKKKADEAAKALAEVTSQQQSKQIAAASLNEAAQAARRAADSLPNDRELPETAQKLATRSEQLTAEAASLTKTIEEKDAVHKPLAEALTAAKPAVDVAVEKLTPLKATMAQAEQFMLIARRRSAADSQLLGALKQRLETTRRLSQLVTLDQAIAAAAEATRLRETELGTAQQHVAEYVPVITQNEANVKAASDAMTVAASAKNAAAAEHTRRNDLASSITAAQGAAEAALQKAGDDAALADVVEKLKGRAVVALTGVSESQSVLTAAETAMIAATQTQEAAQTALADVTAEQSRRQQSASDLNTALVAVKAELAAAESEKNSSIVVLTERLTSDFTVASLKPLTPEELCWSVFQVTGVYGRYWQAEVGELDKSTPLTDEQKQDANAVAVRNLELEQKTFDKLKGNVGTFVTFYGAAAGQPQGDFFSTADQALFAGNGGSINSWVVPANDNVTDRVIRQPDLRVAAEELYLAVLTRMPTEVEVNDVTTYLTDRAADRNVAAQELVWALLNSAEFRFNH